MYVEVIYLKDKKYLWRQLEILRERRSERNFFKDTVKSLKAKKTECLVVLRNDGHILIKSVLL